MCIPGSVYRACGSRGLFSAVQNRASTAPVRSSPCTFWNAQIVSWKSYEKVDDADRAAADPLYAHPSGPRGHERGSEAERCARDPGAAELRLQRRADPDRHRVRARGQPADLERPRAADLHLEPEAAVPADPGRG